MATLTKLSRQCSLGLGVDRRYATPLANSSSAKLPSAKEASELPTTDVSRAPILHDRSLDPALKNLPPILCYGLIAFAPVLGLI